MADPGLIERLRSGMGGKRMGEDPAGGSQPVPGSRENPFTVPGGAAGQWFTGSRPGQFGAPGSSYGSPAQIPENINQIRGMLQEYQHRPTGFPFSEEQKTFMNTWQGVMHAPDFQAGPRMAASSWNEPPSWQNPEVNLMGWKPAQAEQVPQYAS